MIAEQPKDRWHSGSPNVEGVAIIGLAGKFPSAPNVRTFWDMLLRGESGIRDVEIKPESSLPHDPRYVAKTATVDDADHFDATFFGIYPKQAAEMDPQHRLFLQTCWHAMEDAGYAPSATTDRVGVFAGCHMNTYIFCRLAADPELRRSLSDSFPGGSLSEEISNDKDYLATRIAFHLNLRGPCVAVQTACSTSLVAVSQACESLVSGSCDMALAGGATITFPQKQGYLYTEDSILSPDGICRTFDANARGTIFGDGVGAVVLKRLSDAIHDQDSIYAVIKGWGTNNDGGDKAGYTAPSVEGQSAAIELAIDRAQVSAETIDYVEAHGTGTQVGDPIEIAGLTKAFRKSTDKKQFCRIASLKTAFGHLDVAAGVAGVIKTSLALKHRKIPKLLNYSRPNPRIDFENSPFVINEETIDWPETDSPRRAGVSSFGVGGTNAHIILEEPPSQKTFPSERPFHCIPVSGKVAAAADQLAEDVSAFLNASPDASEDIAFTMQAGRTHQPYRTFAVVPSDRSDATVKFKPAGPRSQAECSIAFLFPGQGSQHLQMAKQLYESEPLFARELDDALDQLQLHIGTDLRSLIYGTGDDCQEQLNLTCHAQPALFAISYAMASWWMARGVQPSCVVGHSVGEFAAAVVAGIMTLSEAARLVAVRGRVMQELPRGSMLSINLGRDHALAVMPETLDLAAVNAPALSVLSGPTADIESFQRMTEVSDFGLDIEIASSVLRTSHAFHSRMMDPAIEQFRQVVLETNLQPPALPIFSTVTTRLMESEATDPEYWATQIREPVLFSSTIANLLQQHDGGLLEVGPGQTLTTLARQHKFSETQFVFPSLPHPKQQHSDAERVMQTIGELWVRGVDVNWSSVYAGESRRRIHGPLYPFLERRHWFTPTGDKESRESATQPTNAETHLSPVATKRTDGGETQTSDGSDGESVPVLDPMTTESIAETIVAEQARLMRLQIEMLIAETSEEPSGPN